MSEFEYIKPHRPKPCRPRKTLDRSKNPFRVLLNFTANHSPPPRTCESVYMFIFSTLHIETHVTFRHESPLQKEINIRFITSRIQADSFFSFREINALMHVDKMVMHYFFGDNNSPVY